MRYFALLAGIVAASILPLAVHAQSDDDELLRRHWRLRQLEQGGIVRGDVARPPPRASADGILSPPTSASRPRSFSRPGNGATALPGNSNVASARGRATRLFAGPGDFPPRNYAAYGIVAFRSLANETDRSRFRDICRAYLNAIPPPPADLPVESQMVTVWPVDTREIAAALNVPTPAEKCERAIDHYNLGVSLDFIGKAGLHSREIDGIGPFLLAWAPTATIGQPDAVVLIYDLSRVQNYDRALVRMTRWVNDIEANPDIWGDGFVAETLREKIQALVDRYGDILEGAFRVKT